MRDDVVGDDDRARLEARRGRAGTAPRSRPSTRRGRRRRTARRGCSSVSNASPGIDVDPLLEAGVGDVPGRGLELRRIGLERGDVAAVRRARRRRARSSSSRASRRSRAPRSPGGRRRARRGAHRSSARSGASARSSGRSARSRARSPPRAGAGRRGRGRRASATALPLDGVAHPAAGEMVVHDAACLHGGVDGRRADEPEARPRAAASRAPPTRASTRASRRASAAPAAAPGACAQKSSCSGSPAAAQRDRRARVRDRRLDLAAMADDARRRRAAARRRARRTRATRSGSKPANASRNAGRLRRIVSHERPDWNPSRQSRS